MADNQSLTKNTSVDYIQRDFNSTVDALISFATTNFGQGSSGNNRLWTDFNPASFSRNWAEIVAFVADTFFFYFDNQATESFLQTARTRSAVKNIAEQFGFTPDTAQSASGDATFTFNSAGTIPRGFRVASTTGQQFFVTNPIVAGSAGDFTGTVLQGIIRTEQFTATGLQNEEFDLVGPNVIRDLNNSNSQDISPQISVSGNDYSLVDTFIRLNGTDQPVIEDSLGNVIGGGGRAFTLGERSNGTPFIRFGDGIFGRKLQPGETITVIYRTGGGSEGNIPEETLTTLVDNLSSVDSVTNNNEFSGGSDEQSIQQLRDLIPASLRTLDRAVAKQDYSDILEANFSEVFAASTETNNDDPGVDLNIYVVPQGTGIPQISDNTLLSTRLSDFLDRRKMVTVQFQLADAFGVDALVSLEVFLSNTASKNTVRESIVSALQEFFDLETGGPDGAGIQFSENVLLKDINSLIEEIDGVERFEIKRLTYRPRINENVVGLNSSYNSSDVTIFPDISEVEWLLGAEDEVSETVGEVNFNNDDSTGFSYDSGSGEVTYDFPVDLEKVAAGDDFRDASGSDFTILGFNNSTNKVILDTGLSVDDSSASPGAGGSIRNGDTTFRSFKAFKKIRATATNLSIDSVTDTNLNLSIKSGTGTALSARVLLDNSNVFVPEEFSAGDFFLVDASGNIWDIEENDSNTLTTSITAVNDAAVTNVASGEYNIVTKLTGRDVVFKGSTFNIQYNSVNTVFSAGSQFSQIGTIGDEFQISETQANIGNLGVPLDLISYDSSTGEIRLNASPDLEGVNSEYVLIDSDGQIFNVIGSDNRSKPSTFYDSVNRDASVVLQDSGQGSQLAQGFEVPESETYAIASINLKREGNIVGNLTARIVNDDGSGLPDLGSSVAVSESVNVSDVSKSGFENVKFNFATPPTLSSGTQYHLVLNGDAAYSSSEQSGTKSFDNTGNVDFDYNASSGTVSYASSVDLSNVKAGHFFEDDNGDLFEILAVNDDSDELTLDSGLTVTDDGTNTGGSVIVRDRILVGIDTSSPSYDEGAATPPDEFSSFNGSLWSNSTQGPSAGSFTDSEGNNFSEGDLIFSVEGPKTITVESNLTPTLGTGATTTTRYYDDNNEISLVLGISQGTVTGAASGTLEPTGEGTVAGSAGSDADSFVFRSSSFADDIVNLRANELIQINESDINIQMFGGTN